jgi:hypothetical protein
MPGILDLLNRLADLARAGKIKAVAVVAVTEDEVIAATSSSEKYTETLHFAAATLTHKLLTGEKEGE